MGSHLPQHQAIIFHLRAQNIILMLYKRRKNKDCSPEADDVESLEAAATKHVEFLKQ